MNLHMLNKPAWVPSPTVNYAQLAELSLREEIDLAPKPGLVDIESNGSHKDMCYALFNKSIDAIAPWFSVFYQYGYEHPELEPSILLTTLRPVGLACEQAMFEATNGINTHKGGIFSLGLLCCAAGHLSAQKQIIGVDSLCKRVSAMCRGMVKRELMQSSPKTAGARIYRQYGFPGARGEAESGFELVRKQILPDWRYNADLKTELLRTLLKLMASNCDTNLISRGGITGLTFVQNYANRLLKTAWSLDDLRLMDQELIRRNLSPGGSADLLSVTFFLKSIPT